MTDYAVLLSNVEKNYGKKGKTPPVLNGINLHVVRGTIYGLLGPSGCGKTTALRCAIGRLGIDSGNIITLGKPPNTTGHGVPGSRVGYMPQELALYQELTVGETLTMFGRLHSLPASRIRERIAFLLQFLHLPEESRLISKLSGGQQRRTSFAISLLHEPELLILDEPTVGVDPLLRQRIWEHLGHLARDSRITIIITTHYIDEARQADQVGLMRNGRLLAEASPDQLLQTYRKQQLEEVFFALCEQDQVGDIELNDVDSSLQLPATDHTSPNGDARLLDASTDIQTDGTGDDDPLLMLPTENTEKVSLKRRLREWLPSCMNIIALIAKQLTLMRRNIGALLFEFLLPAFQIVLFCLCVGRTPFDLSMAVVNQETGAPCGPKPCEMTTFNASCCYLSFLDKHTIIQEELGGDFEAGYHRVKEAKSWGMLHMEANFTQALVARMFAGQSNQTLSNATISASEVHVYLDMTNQQVALVLQSEVLRAMDRFLQYTLRMLGKNPDTAQIPIHYEEPIYGESQPSFTDFMAPGIVLSITFFMATGLTALVFVVERKQGLLDRTLTSGATAVEIMLAHVCSQCIIMAGQVGLLLIVVLLVFKVSCEGPVALVVVLTLMQGLVGMSLGLVISAVCTEEMSAIQAALGSVYPNLLLSGIIWPLEGMPHALRYFSQVLPMTYAAEAMRSILSRGWGLGYVLVWRGFLATFLWGFSLLVISALIFRFRRL